MVESTSLIEPERRHEIAPVELLFDVVFVFATAQLSHHLLEFLSWRGAAESLVLLLAVYSVWFRTSWSATIIPADQSRTRSMMLAVMLVGLFMNASISRAFVTSGWAFVIPFLVIHIGRNIWTYVYAPNAAYRIHYFRVFVWLILSAPFWIMGAAASPNARLYWWGLAAGIDLLGTLLAHPFFGSHLESEDLDFDIGHMMERCGLFLIIALGETVLSTGVALAEAPISRMTVVTGASAFVGTVALWALTFGSARRLTLRYESESPDPVRTSRYAVYALIGLFAGLIAVAVGSEMVVAHPQGHASAGLSWLLYGGAILYLIAQSWYLRPVASDTSRMRILGCVALALIGVITTFTQPWVALLVLGASLTAMVFLDRQMIPAD